MQVETFVEMCEMEIVQQMGRSGTRLVDVQYIILVVFWPRNTTPNVAHRPIELNRSVCDISVL